MDAYILIIDDDITVSTMMRRGLTYEGYEVVVAADGRAGLLKALERQPDSNIKPHAMHGRTEQEVP